MATQEINAFANHTPIDGTYIVGQDVDNSGGKMSITTILALPRSSNIDMKTYTLDTTTVNGNLLFDADGTGGFVFGTGHTTATGTKTVIAGQNHVDVDADYSAIFGDDNSQASPLDSVGDYCLIAGKINYNNSGNNCLITGSSNYSNSGHYCVIGGYQNVTNTGVGCAIFGQGNNTNSGTYSSITGSNNYSNAGDFCSISGTYNYGNTLTADYCMITGQQNHTNSGSHCLIAGNGNNSNSGTHCSFSGSDHYSNSGNYCDISGGGNDTNTGGWCSIAGSGNHHNSGDYCSISGSNNYSNSGDSCLITGDSNHTNSGNYSVLTGKQSSNALQGAVVHSAGRFAANGDAQIRTLVSRNATTGVDTDTELFLDGATATKRMVIPTNTAWNFECFIVATHQGMANIQRFKRTGLIVNDGGTVTMAAEETMDTDLTIGTPGALSVDIEADDTNDALIIQVTGVAVTNIRWVAKTQLTEVSYA